MIVKSPKCTEQGTRDRMSAAALARGKGETDLIHWRVRVMVAVIAQEIGENSGTYPLGALSQAEVARRSDIHPQTFYKEKYRELAAQVAGWLTSLKRPPEVKRVGTRKDLRGRLDTWRQLYEDLLETHRLTETDLLIAEDIIRNLRLENETLQAERASERRSKVVRLTK